MLMGNRYLEESKAVMRMWSGLAERFGVVSLGVLNRDVRFYKLNE